jgi:hypothetical protein
MISSELMAGICVTDNDGERPSFWLAVDKFEAGTPKVSFQTLPDLATVGPRGQIDVMQAEVTIKLTILINTCRCGFKLGTARVYQQRNPLG